MAFAQHCILMIRSSCRSALTPGSYNMFALPLCWRTGKLARKKSCNYLICPSKSTILLPGRLLKPLWPHTQLWNVGSGLIMLGGLITIRNGFNKPTNAVCFLANAICLRKNDLLLSRRSPALPPWTPVLSLKNILNRANRNNFQMTPPFWIILLWN